MAKPPNPAAIVELNRRQRADSEAHVRSMLRQRPLPAVSDFVAALSRTDFTKHQDLLAGHPGAPLFERLADYRRAHRMLRSFYDDLMGGFGRFQGHASAGLAFRDGTSNEGDDFRKVLFGFCCAAKAADAMLEKFAHKRTPRGTQIASMARAAGFKDVELAAFVHELRNHLSHVVPETPSTSVTWPDHPNHPVATVVLRNAAFNANSRWDSGARAFLRRADETDVMATAAAYVQMSQKTYEEVLKTFWGGLTDDEKHYAEISARLQFRGELTSYGIIAQILAQRADLDVLRFLHERVDSNQLAMVRALPDRSQEQFDALVRLLDPFDLAPASLLDRLRAVYTRPPSSSPSARHLKRHD
jgi:hypothetical protein